MQTRLPVVIAAACTVCCYVAAPFGVTASCDNKDNRADENASEATFRLENGLQVILVPEPRPTSVVALGLKVGVYTEPEGRCGVSHLAEHLFWHGGSKSFAPGKAFERLTLDGPLGSAYQDVNAETMWNLTYFYAARPGAAVNVALEIFAEKLSGVIVSQELLDAERRKVLEEIESASAAMAKATPFVRQQLEQLVRYPKAGIESGVNALKVEHVEAYLAAHYRPDRAVLLVNGPIDPPAVRQRIEALFGPCRARDGRPLPEGPLKEIPEQVIASYAIATATEREWSALRVAAAAWESNLRKQSRAYVELSPDGTLRAVLLGSDSSSLVASRDVLHVPLAAADFRRARAKAGEKAKMIRGFTAQYRTAQAKDEKTQVRIQLQSAIDRLRFEAEGGQALLDQLETLTPDDVAAAAKKFLTAEVEQVRQVKPE